MINEKVQYDILIGITAGIVSGLILVFSQFIAELYGQKYNILLIAALCFLILIIIIFFFAFSNTRKEKREHIKS